LRARTIVELRQRLGERPREFTRAERRYVALERPGWLNAWDPLTLQVRQSAPLASDGRVVWGAIVQGNAALWREGDEDLPGVMLVDVEGCLDDQAWELADLAQELFEIGQRDSEELVPGDSGPEGEAPEEKVLLGTVEERLAVKEFLDGHLVAAPLRLGPEISGGRALELVTVLVCRRHLPDGVMVDPLLPVYVRKGTLCVFPVPAAYWPDRILYAWRALGRRPTPRRSLPRKQILQGLGILLLTCAILFGIWVSYERGQEAKARQQAAQATQRARLKAKKDALLKTQTLPANLKRLKSAPLATRPELVARWREEQGDAPGSRLELFALASSWPDSERVDAELLPSLELSPMDPGEVLDCLELENLKLTYRRALLAHLEMRENLSAPLTSRLRATIETPELERLECWLGFGRGEAADLEPLLAKRSPRWLESEAGRDFLWKVAQNGPLILSHLTTSVDLRVRREVARALGGSQHADAEPLRERLREDPDPEVQHAVRPR